MKKNLSIILFFSLTILSCQKKYGCDDLEFRNGLKYEKGSVKLADGKFECIEDRDGQGYIHETYMNYEGGRNVGEWEYLVQNDIIHYGRIIRNNELEKTLSQNFGAKNIELDVWHEGDFNFFDLRVFEPKNILDSLQIQNIVNGELKPFILKYNVTGVTINTLNKNGEWDTKFFKL